ncbi:DNA-binding transcriptional regulator, AcrR family [Nocardioides exalbidus]|uniref:DNA-binding transcriptional regulator, AcrR family n=1 Tax=Nocardioides exalbidus TaxID=402596 RepID=A0A1H4QR55_9ACTN|nr:TetR family transcriptional regulator [Nocardioides exalbidus]SEC22085.1 DNA-binding transcriptional regulator, AcrR family [Nocardioides exalbidus]
MGEKGAATRARILEAARVEFAEFGFAGARVDRIAERAQANKAQLYSYFGNKDALFDAVLDDALVSIVDAVPIDAADLPGYAVRLYDHYLDEPWVIRLATWTRLERRPSGPLTPEPMPREPEKLAAIAAAQEDGLVDPTLSPAEVFGTVIALSMTWSPASTTFAATADDAVPEHDRRRAVLRTIVARAFAPTSG